LQDGVITRVEEDDLDNVRRLLGIAQSRYEEMHLQAKTDVIAPVRPSKGGKPDVQNLTGKLICFTGALTSRIDGEVVSREMAEQIASERGMVIVGHVIKKLDFLVTADPNSMSGKAQKARAYGVRIIAEPVFWRMVGVQVE
ncbi:MAG TPA: BRCT domain-containing protein, partial [Phycisphaerae bacterium]|nr:BRCT domain-containing protein [Phycisphaerae bacterium]